MNKIYKVIWSKVKNSYVVVPEIAASSSKNKGNKAYKSALAAVLTAMLGFGGFVGSEAATVNDGDTLNGSTHITVTKDPATKTITISTTGLATTGDLATLSTQVNTNTGNINNNATHISTNATNISTNAGNISNNTLKINTLTALTNSLGLDAAKPGIKYFRANSTGADASAVGSDAVAVGTQARATKDNAMAMGVEAKAEAEDSVSVGHASRNVSNAVNGASTKGMAVYNSDGTYAYAGGTPAGVVTVGAKGKERRIQNVAAGLVAPQSTDAVNGSQLYTMTRPLRFGGDNSTIGATSAADVNVVKRGSDQVMSILGGADGSKLSDNNIGVVADAANNKFNVKLAKELKDLTSVTTKDAAGNTTVTNGAGMTVTDSAGNKTEVTAGGVTITPKTPGPGKTNVSLTADGLNNGGNQIHNVEKGTADTDAVNVSQLKAQSSDLIQKGFVVGDGKNITTKVEGGKVKVALKDDINVNSVTTKDAAGNTTVTNGAGTTITDSTGNKTEVTAGGITITPKTPGPGKTNVSLTADGLNNGGNQIHNVAKGTAGTDAVNVDQLKDEIAANATKLVDGKNTTVEGDGTAANPYKVNVKDNINLGEKGANGKDGSIGVNGKDGSAVVINGKDGSIGLNGKDGANGLTIKGGDGKPGVDGTNITRLIIEEKNGDKHDVATLDDGLKFAGNTGTVAKKLNETMTIKGTGTKADTEYDSSNIKTMVNSNGEMIVGLDKNLKSETIVATGKDGKDGKIGINGKDGVTTNISVTRDGKPGVDGAPGTTTTRIVYEKPDGSKEEVATLNDGMKYGGDTGAVIKKKLNEQVNVVGGITDTNKLTTEDNLGVVSDGNNNLKVRMAKDLKGLETVMTKTVTAETGNITTVNSDTVNAKTVNATTVKTGDTTINDNGLTINNGPSITKNGVDAGDKKITNVAPGDISPTSKDAVNGSQLFQTNQSISKLGDRVNKVGAGAAALASLHPLDFDPDDKWDVAAGYGHYRNANAGAIGVFYRPNEDTMFSVGGSFGGGENMVNAGVSLKLGQGNNVSTSKVAMAKEIKDLRKEVEQLRGALGQVVQGQALDPMKIKLFPDVPENHWAYEYIATLAGNGILEGYPDGNFGGDRMMTRYEFGAIVYRAMQRGFEVPARMLKEFEPELERFRVDTIAQNKAGQPTIERVRVIHNR